MASALRSLALSRWRTACIAAACAVAGGGLRWSFRKQDAVRADGALTSPAMPVSKPHVLLTVDSLPALSGRDRLTALAAMLPHMNVKEIAPLVAVLAASCQEGGGGWGTPESTEALLRVLFTRWAELDAPGMIAALEAPAYIYSLSARQLAVSAWTELHGIAALEAVAKKWPGIASAAAWEHLRRRPEQMEVLIPLLDGDMMLYPDDDAALKELLGPERYVHLAAAMGQRGFVWSILREVAREDFRGALQIAKSLPPGDYREAAMGEVLDQLNPRYDLSDSAKSSGVSFREEFEALPPGMARDRLSDNYAWLLAQENTESALTWARSLPPGEVRSEALSGVACALSNQASPPDAESPFFKASCPDAVRIFAEAWLAYPHTQDSSLVSSFANWRDADPRAAEAWFETVTDPLLRDFLTRELPGPFEEHRSQTMPAENARADALAAIAKDGVKDEAWAAASTEDRRFLGADAMRARAGEYAPGKALEFFNALAPEERSLGAWYEAGRAQVGMDVEKASQWMQSMPPGPERDAAVTALVQHLTGTGESAYQTSLLLFSATYPANDRDAAAAFAWAASMSGETERSRYLTQAAKAWALEDAAAARVAVIAASLTEAEKESLLRQLPEGGVR